ncbi:ATP-dependent DNA helicase PIF1-like protein [Tanacetum coccineum]
MSKFMMKLDEERQQCLSRMILFGKSFFGKIWKCCCAVAVYKKNWLIFSPATCRWGKITLNDNTIESKRIEKGHVAVEDTATSGTNSLTKNYVEALFSAGEIVAVAMTAEIRSECGIVFNVASNGIAAILLDEGRTVHSQFALPINDFEDSICSFSYYGDLVDLIRKTKLIIWDEAPMVNRNCFETLERTMADIWRRDDGTQRRSQKMI